MIETGASAGVLWAEGQLSARTLVGEGVQRNKRGRHHASRPQREQQCIGQPKKKKCNQTGSEAEGLNNRMDAVNPIGA